MGWRINFPGQTRLAPLMLLIAACASSAQANPGEEPAEGHFLDRFEPYDIPPQFYELEDGAVDIAALEPPIEEAPPGVLRSLGQGVASYYGRRFHGRRTANGERFDMHAMTAAHKTLPFGSRVRVTNPSNGRSVVVRINDRGPFARGRVIDLSRAAAEEIGMIRRGHARVEIDLLAP